MFRAELTRLALGALAATAAALSCAGAADPSVAGPDAPTASSGAGAGVLLAAAQAQAETAFRSRDYAAAVAWSQRYFKQGGADARMRAVLGRSLYHINDFENAARSLHVEVAAAEKSNQAPAEDGLKLLVACYARLNDVAGQNWALEKLVTYYAKKEHWAELIALAEKRANFGDGLALDLWRLKFATGTLESGADYMHAATLALEAGYPAEAKAVLDKGFAGGKLGTGTEAESHRRLRDLVGRQAAEGRSAIAGGEPQLPASGPGFGSPLVNAGFRLVTYGESARGIAMMERGLQQTGNNRPQVDKLHLGIAYLIAGRPSEAMATFKTVTGVHGAADLGALWYLQALQSSINR